LLLLECEGEAVEELVGRCVGNYRLEARLGGGGMGEVYRARHVEIGKIVAVKVLHRHLRDREMLARFFQEAKAVNEIAHPNVVEVLDFGTSADGLVYCTMEYLEGESLADRICGAGLTVEESRNILRQCCTALEASHARGIIHRDLKPENIFLVKRDGRDFVKILDFGIAKLTRRDRYVVKTATGEIFGTPVYMSPEQALGAGVVDERSDIYSLGVVLYELVTGQVPFDGTSITEILMARLQRAPEPPRSLNREIDAALEVTVLRALERDPARRFPSMAAFRRALENPAAAARELVMPRRRQSWWARAFSAMTAMVVLFAAAPSSEFVRVSPPPPVPTATPLAPPASPARTELRAPSIARAHAHDRAAKRAQHAQPTTLAPPLVPASYDDLRLMHPLFSNR
jgi:serine/threonine-protein kinase